MKKVLFICNQNQNRSKTAEELFRDKFETKSAGLFNKSPVSVKELGWADVVLVMEEEQRHELAKRFPKIYLKKRILNLDIPDVYAHGDPRLVGILKLKVEGLL